MVEVAKILLEFVIVFLIVYLGIYFLGHIRTEAEELGSGDLTREKRRLASLRGHRESPSCFFSSPCT